MKAAILFLTICWPALADSPAIEFIDKAAKHVSEGNFEVAGVELSRIEGMARQNGAPVLTSQQMQAGYAAGKTSDPAQLIEQLRAAAATNDWAKIQEHSFAAAMGAINAVRKMDPEVRYRFAKEYASSDGGPAEARFAARVAYDTAHYQEALYWLERESSSIPESFPPKLVPFVRNMSRNLEGAVYLKQGDVPRAKDTLLHSLDGVTPESVKVSGPNMFLAKLLLEQKQVEPVLAYLDQCTASNLYPKCATWRAEVAAGSIPNFGPAANMY